MTTPLPAAGGSPAAGSASATANPGNIYDLGYQGYDGPRLGRRHAVWALYVYSLRGTFGIGRSGRAKLAPFGFAFLALLPALIAVGVTALLTQAGRPPGIESPIGYDTYLGFSLTLMILFCAAQAPELLGRDQRYHVLPLYFSRALRRADYALAKLLALWTALVLVFLAPEALIFAGRVLAARDVPAAFVDNVAAVPPILAVCASASLLLGGISLALASFTPRRAYATASIIAAFIIPPIVASIVAELASGSITRVVVLLDPTDMLDGANAWFFGRSADSEVLRAAALPDPLYAVGVITYGVVAALATLRRYMRIAA